MKRFTVVALLAALAISNIPAAGAASASGGEVQLVPLTTGGGGKSNQATLTVNPVSPNPRTYVSGDQVTLSTSGGSGSGAVSFFVVSGPGSLSGAVLSINGAGSIVVNAVKAADVNYNSATSANLTITVNAAVPTTYYVDAARSDDSGDGLSWSAAKKSIQAAIGLVSSNDTIVVTNGIYAPISITNDLSILIRSVNGAAGTIIDGGGTNRCATLGVDQSYYTNTVLTGFTLRNGNAAENGGGSCFGTLNNCTVSGNTSSDGGGGSYYGMLNNCTLSGNTARFGGGSAWGTLNNCTLSGNTAQTGAGSFQGVLNNCVLSGNTASQAVGGSYMGVLNNCVLSGNTAPMAGGSADSTLNNCTLSGNAATHMCGGSAEDTLNNCIVWGNTAPAAPNCYNSILSGSCTTPLEPGTGNIEADPLFVDAAAMDFRLQTGSPCINAGLNKLVSGETDLDGNVRIVGGAVDMGCYEWLPNQAELVVVDAGSKVYGDAAFQLSTTGGSGTGIVTYVWVSGPGTVSSSGLVTITGVGSIVVKAMKAGDGNYNSATSVILTITVNAPGPTTYYVDAARSDDSGDGLSWSAAKKSIQAAIELVSSNDTIVVTNGVYAPISITNDLPILIRSVNGAAGTIIDGGGTNRCATLGADESHTNTVLAGFTLRNGNVVGVMGDVQSSGGGACYGTLNNCTLTGNTATGVGGGSAYGALNNCTLRGNTCTWYGGGSYGGILNNCKIMGNTAYYAGGSYYGTLNNCTLSGNTAKDGGASYHSTLNNCILTGNTATERGGGSINGTLNNCTLIGNRAGLGSGGSDYGALNNCIVWGNTAPMNANYSSGTFTSSCSTPLPPGTGNIDTDPCFRLPEAGDFRLLAGSPCLDAGLNAYAVGDTDLAGNARIQNGNVDMGAYEGISTVVTGAEGQVRNLVASTNRADGILISWSAPSSGTAVLYRVLKKEAGETAFTPVSDWQREFSFLDTAVWPRKDYSYAVVAAFDENLAEIAALPSNSVVGLRPLAPCYYVDAANGTDANDGGSWRTAKRTIQSAIDLTAGYETILVTNGTYAPIAAVDKNIGIASVNGAAVTIIDGGGTNRCATLGSGSFSPNAELTGFTLRNGNVTGRDGGGSYFGTLNNCVLSGNVGRRGGGSYYGTLNNCTLSGNTVSEAGGGSYYGTLNNCTLSGNTAGTGGGSAFGTLNNCTLSENTAQNGGGSFQGVLNNCILSGNTASQAVGGSNQGVLNNCLLIGNTAPVVGGSLLGTLNNCTLSGNAATQICGGSAMDTLNNCIVWGNTAPDGANCYQSTLSGSCTTPLAPGTGNIDADPLFVDAVAMDFRLQAGSPCIDAGLNKLVSGETDLDGNARIVGGTVDMGCYEFFAASTSSVIFDPQGGALVPAESGTMPFGTVYTNLPSAVRLDYAFSGWYGSWTNNAVLATNGMSVLSPSNHVLYAKWIAVARVGGVVAATNGFGVVLNPDGKGVSIKSLPSISGPVVIPDRIPNTPDGLPVTDVPSYGFYNRKGITDVTMGLFVTNIADFGFAYCSGLTNVTLLRPVDARTGLPTGLTIGKAAFALCESLVSATIPEGTKYIGSLAFAQCFKLTNVTFACSVAPAMAADVFKGTPKTGTLTVQVPFGSTGYSGGVWDTVTVEVLPALRRFLSLSIDRFGKETDAPSALRTFSALPTAERFSLAFSVSGGAGQSPAQAMGQLLAESRDRIVVEYRARLEDGAEQLSPVSIADNGDGSATVSVDVPAGRRQGFFRIVIKD